VIHPELNPIELVWGIVKNECARQMKKGLSFKKVREHLEKALSDVSPELCVKLYEHVKKEEAAFWQTDIELEALEEEEVIVKWRCCRNRIKRKQE